MARKLVGIATLWVLASGLLAAANFWETKPFTTWTDKELQQIASDSPWARKVSVTAPARGGDGGGGGRGGGGGGRGGGGGGAAPEIQLTIAWRSSLPMKEVLVRIQVGANGPVPAASQDMLDRKEDIYAVTVVGLPVRLAAAVGNLTMDTSLRAGKRAPIAPEDAFVQPTGNEAMLVFAFPKTRPITLEDKDVEFVTKLGSLEIKKKFNLKDMVFHGQLEM